MSEEEQLSLVQKDGESIYWIYTSLGGTYMHNSNGFEGACLEPSEAVKMAAVKQGGRSIKWINNPSEDVQLAAVESHADAFLWIHHRVTKKPEISEKVKLLAVEKKPELITVLKDPSEELQLLAIGKIPSLIKEYKNPCDAAINLAKKLLRK